MMAGLMDAGMSPSWVGKFYSKTGTLPVRRFFNQKFDNCRLDFWGNADLASVNLFKINNGNTRAMCEICSKLILKTTTLGSFEQISHIVLMFVFPILKELVTVGNCQQPAFSLKNFPHRFYMCHHSIVTVYREAWYLER